MTVTTAGNLSSY